MTERCKRCGKFLWKTDFSGKPFPCGCIRFKIEDEYGEEYIRYAYSVQEVAERFAEDSDDEHNLIDNTKTILVDGVPYELSAEVAVDYTATRIKKEANDDT